MVKHVALSTVQGASMSRFACAGSRKACGCRSAHGDRVQLQARRLECTSREAGPVLKERRQSCRLKSVGSGRLKGKARGGGVGNAVVLETRLRLARIISSKTYFVQGKKK